VSARADRLLGERQSITDSKKFRAAKNKLSVASRRDGFGRGGEWSWALPASLTVDPAETAADITPEVPTSVIYADHSRPVRSGNADQTTSTGVLDTPPQTIATTRDTYPPAFLGPFGKSLTVFRAETASKHRSPSPILAKRRNLRNLGSI